MRIVETLLVALVAASCLSAQTSSDFQADFDVAIERIGATYAYFDAKATRWDNVAALYRADARTVRTGDEFVALLERVVDELYDPHAHLTVNLAKSSRLVPSGTDLWAEWRGTDATITQVRDNSDAARAGLRSGAVVIATNGIPISDAVEQRMGRSYSHSVSAARDWALRSVLAGQHNTARSIEVREAGVTRTVALPPGDQFTVRGAPLDFSEVQPGIGFVRFNDSLGDDAAVAAFVLALERLRQTRGLIIDLRNTPGGGNTGVAEGILGRFVERQMPYQQHALPAVLPSKGNGRTWLAYVSPRGPFRYGRPVAVLVGRWTGSMGEGLAMGFEATGVGTVVGTPMAGLVGATTRIVLPRTRVGISVPYERFSHVNGTPRERYLPSVLIEGLPALGRDPFVDAALKVLGIQ